MQVLIQPTLGSVPETDVACPGMPDGFGCSVTLQVTFAFNTQYVRIVALRSKHRSGFAMPLTMPLLC